MLSRALPALALLAVIATLLAVSIVLDLYWLGNILLVVVLLTPILAIPAFFISVFVLSPQHRSGYLDVRSNASAMVLLWLILVSLPIAVLMLWVLSHVAVAAAGAN